MCTNYEFYHGIDELSKDYNTLLQFAKHMSDHNHIYVIPGKECVDNDKVIAHVLQQFFSSGIEDELNPRFDFTLCEEVSIDESAPITYHL